MKKIKIVDENPLGELDFSGQRSSEAPSFRRAGKFEVAAKAPSIVDIAEELRLEGVQIAAANGQAEDSSQLESLG